MYCNKCGKEISSGTICEECMRKEYGYQPPNYSAQNGYSQNQNYSGYANYGQYETKAYYTNEPEPQNRMYGFGKALTSTILGVVGFFFVYIALIMSALEPESGLALFFISTPLVIIPLIFGISSIKTFCRRKAPCVKPIATLILGISGLVWAAISLILYFLAFVIIATLI